MVSPPRLIPMIWRAPLELVARGLGLQLDEVQGRSIAS